MEKDISGSIDRSIAVLVAAVVWFINSELFLQAFNYQSGMFWFTVAETIIIICCTAYGQNNNAWHFSLILSTIVIIAYIAATILGSRLANAKSYANVMQVPTEAGNSDIIPDVKPWEPA
jgi:uncharacterized membrane protein